MRLLVWQWGRFGAGPRYAASLAGAVSELPGSQGLLSLSAQAELLNSPAAPACELPMHTYAGAAGFALRFALSPFSVPGLARRVGALRPDLALCAMPGPLDGLMAAALRRAGVPFSVVVHDADAHPGDGLPFQMRLQRRLVRKADGLVALTDHVAARLRGQGFPRPVLRTRLPPLRYGPPVPPRPEGGPFRILLFGRLLPYKGLDLFADALDRLGAHPQPHVRVAGQGPESLELDRLRRWGAQVENRWIPEDEVGPLLAWADAVVLSHREASQSGIAAAALAAGRWIVATRVGGLTEQLTGRDAALLCAPDPDALADALRAVQARGRPPRNLAAAVDQEWRNAAAELLEQLRAALPARQA